MPFQTSTDKASVIPSPAIYPEPNYQRELRGYATIIKGFSGHDFPPAIHELVNEASKTREQKPQGEP